MVRYTSFAPASVTVSFGLAGPRGALRLPSVHARFARQGLFRVAERLGLPRMQRVRAARRFTVRMRIAGSPGRCARHVVRHLTIRHAAGGRIVWLQSDSRLGGDR